MIDQPYQFDFYDGGGLDLAFLSFAEVDAQGNVNVSRFGNRIIGPGGFINISQNAKTVSSAAPSPAGKPEIGWPGGITKIARDGSRSASSSRTVEQITYSGSLRPRARAARRSTSPSARCSGCAEQGLELIEIAPGIDLERDVFAHMEFRPDVAADLRTMDARLFRPEPMGLADDLARRGARVRSSRLAEIA